MMSEPVCGEVNNKHYKNECELRKEECQTGKRIGISITPCQGKCTRFLLILKQQIVFTTSCGSLVLIF